MRRSSRPAASSSCSVVSRRSVRRRGHSVKFPPAFSREELENISFVREQKNLVLYGPVGVGKTHMAIVCSPMSMVAYGVTVYIIA